MKTRLSRDSVTTCTTICRKVRQIADSSRGSDVPAPSQTGCWKYIEKEKLKQDCSKTVCPLTRPVSRLHSVLNCGK